jgi:hypothetical protein
MNQYVKKYEKEFTQALDLIPNINNLEFEDYNELDSGVYLLYNDLLLVYVGISSNLPQRISSHHGNKTFNKVKILREKEYWKCAIIEAFYIKKYEPYYNKSFGVLSNAIYNSKYKSIDEFNIFGIRIPNGWQDTQTIKAHKTKTNTI